MSADQGVRHRSYDPEAARARTLERWRSLPHPERHERVEEALLDVANAQARIEQRMAVFERVAQNTEGLGDEIRKTFSGISRHLAQQDAQAVRLRRKWTARDAALLIGVVLAGIASIIAATRGLPPPQQQQPAVIAPQQK